MNNTPNPEQEDSFLSGQEPQTDIMPESSENPEPVTEESLPIEDSSPAEEDALLQTADSIGDTLARTMEIEQSVEEAILAQETADLISADQTPGEDVTEEILPPEGPLIPEDLLTIPEETKAEEDEPSFFDRPVVKGRPRHKKGEGLFGIPNILVTLVWVALTLLIGVTLGRMIWICAADVLAFGKEDRPVTITVYETDDIDSVTDKLYSARLIRYPGLFRLYAKFAVDEGEIHPGIWDLNSKYDYHALVKMMSPSSSRDVIKVMIPEGYNCRQIFTLLEENKVCTVQDIASYAASGELNEYWFLEGLERGDKYCLEGFLFPDTYEFYKNDKPRNVLQKMLDNFEVKFTEEMIWQIDQLNGRLADVMRANGRGDDYIASHTLTLRDIITVASMVEKETATAEEGYTIASVIYNRLYDWGGTPAYLNIDATIIYALDGKADLTAEDLRVDSPYNTYTHVGLTPGPIANPGLSSIQAALNPAKTDYYFYVLDPNQGTHHFSRTQEEHDAFRASLGG